MNLLSRFTKPDYKDGEDFLNNYTYTAPANFNFARDVIDEYARLAPDQTLSLIHILEGTSVVRITEVSSPSGLRSSTGLSRQSVEGMPRFSSQWGLMKE